MNACIDYGAYINTYEYEDKDIDLSDPHWSPLFSDFKWNSVPDYDSKFTALGTLYFNILKYVKRHVKLLMFNSNQRHAKTHYHFLFPTNKRKIITGSNLQTEDAAVELFAA